MDGPGKFPQVCIDSKCTSPEGNKWAKQVGDKPATCGTAFCCGDKEGCGGAVEGGGGEGENVQCTQCMSGMGPNGGFPKVCIDSKCTSPEGNKWAKQVGDKPATCGVVPHCGETTLLVVHQSSSPIL